jgi:hypothetical protein
MTQQFNNPDLNALVAKIQAYEAKTPRDDQERRDFEMIIGRLKMALNDQKAQPS